MTAVQQPLAPIGLQSSVDRVVHPSFPAPREIQTNLNYYKDPPGGGPPAPTIVGQIETYDRPSAVHSVTVHDISGHESEFTLDKNGFQIYKHVSAERDFLDDDQIKATYYPETEQLLKDVSVAQLT